jgi:hypothetical protein
MPSSNLTAVVVPEHVELAEVAGYEPFPRLVDVVRCDPFGERPQVVAGGIEHPRRHRAPVRLLERIGAPIHKIASFGRTFRNQVIRFSVCACGGSGLNVTMLTLAVLVMICHGDPPPTPTPTPIPF